MSKSIKSLCAVSLLVLVAACGNKAGDVEEFVVVDPVPVSVEPTFTSKH